jgi:putative ABC transport system permease protein
MIVVAIRFVLMVTPLVVGIALFVTGDAQTFIKAMMANKPTSSGPKLPWYVPAAIGLSTFSAFALGLFFYVLRCIEDGLTLLGELRDRGWPVPGVKFALMVFKSLQRNQTRTALTYLATFVLVFVVTMIWSILAFIDQVRADKAEDMKVIITEKFSIPSQMPRSYIDRVWRISQELPEDLRPTADDFNTWQFVGGSLDPQKMTFENSIFFFALPPRSLGTMMDHIERTVSRKNGYVTDNLSPQDRATLNENIAKMEQNLQACVIGPEKLRQLNKKVGDRIKFTSFNYKDLEFEMEIVGTFPPGNYDLSSAMNRDYLNRMLDDYDNKNKPNKHPLSEKTVNLIWMRLPNRDAFNRMSEQINSPGNFSSPAVKMEASGAAIGSFLEAWRDIIRGMRWLLSPAIMASMCLIISIAISIGVRERRTEMAVLKVLGFQPNQILFLVLGESLLIGVLGGTLSAGVAYFGINVMGGVPFPVAFFPTFFIPKEALLWGPLLGLGTAFFGSIIPAWSARRVKVSDVFSKTT